MSNLPGAYAFEVKQGGPWSDTVTWSINAVPVDLTGYTVTLRVRFANVTQSFVSPTNITVNASGVITWTVPQTLVDAWPIGFASYDLKAVSGDGTPNWLLAGTLEVIA